MKRSLTQAPSSSNKNKSQMDITHKSYSLTQIPEDDRIFDEIDLKKPKTAYNFFIAEMMEKNKLTLIEASTKFGSKWKEMTKQQRQKYDELAQEDKKRYSSALEMARKYVLQKPMKENVTSYRIFLNEKIKEAIDNDEDVKEAKKNAADEWKNMSREDRRQYDKMKEENLKFYDSLRVSQKSMSPYALFVQDIKTKDPKLTFAEIAEKWKKASDKVKSKYDRLFKEHKDENEKMRDLYEIAHGIQPKRPNGPFNFYIMQLAKDGRFDNLEGNIIKEAAAMWKKCSEDEKDIYRSMAKKQRLAYTIKKMEFNETVKKQSSGSRAKSAFNIFLEENKHLLEKADLTTTTVFDFMYEKYNKLTKAEKEKYKKKATLSRTDAKKERDELAKRVYNEPSKPPNAYNLFIKDKSTTMKDKQASDRFKILAEQWGKMTDKQKSKYYNKADEVKDVYKSQKKQFAKDGFYVDPSRSASKRKTMKKSNDDDEKRGRSSSKDGKRSMKKSQQAEKIGSSSTKSRK